ncbi:hypothetical protein MCERHM31_00806 [Methylophilaceae bacterium]
MAYFAKLDENDMVTDVLALNNIEMLNSDGVESEDMGKTFFIRLSGGYSKWVQTSFNASIRKNYAGIGYTYDRVRDAFIAPQPFASWILNEETCQWKAPTPMPIDGKIYVWNEEIINWAEVV